MIARWQFWRVHTDIKLRHTGTPYNERFICNCVNDLVAEELVELLNSIRFMPEQIAEVFENATRRGVDK